VVGQVIGPGVNGDVFNYLIVGREVDGEEAIAVDGLFVEQAVEDAVAEVGGGYEIELSLGVAVYKAQVGALPGSLG